MLKKGLKSKIYEWITLSEYNLNFTVLFMNYRLNNNLD